MLEMSSDPQNITQKKTSKEIADELITDMESNIELHKQWDREGILSGQNKAYYVNLSSAVEKFKRRQKQIDYSISRKSKNAKEKYEKVMKDIITIEKEKTLKNVRELLAKEKRLFNLRSE